MTDAVTQIVYRSASRVQTKVLTLAHTSVYPGGSGQPTGGITQAQADVRYVQQSQIAGGTTGQVATKASAADGDIEWREPSIPYSSTNW